MLCPPGTGWERRRAGHVVAQPVVGVRLRLDFCLCQEHETKPVALQCPDGLCQSEAPAILDVECTDGDLGWELGPAA